MRIENAEERAIRKENANSSETITIKLKWRARYAIANYVEQSQAEHLCDEQAKEVEWTFK